MKFYLKCILGLVSLLPVSALADSWYDLYVTNTLTVPISLSKVSRECINQGPYWYAGGADETTIYPGESVRVAEWQDYNGNEWGNFCWNGEKNISFVVDAELDEDSKIPENDYSLYFRWFHKNTKDGPGGLNWKSRIDKISSSPNIPFTISQASCTQNNMNPTNCLNTYAVQKNSRESVYVTIGVRALGEGFFRFSSLNLGDISVTTAYGKPMKYDPISNAINLTELSGKFDVKFSKTTRFCKVRESELICPTSIGYWFTSDESNKDYPDERFVFACHQTESSDVPCPWTMKNESAFPTF